MFVIATAAIAYSTADRVGAQSFDPTTLPKLAFENLTYVGAFKVPAQGSNGDTFEIGGNAAAFNPNANSLFIGARSGKVAELSIPTPAKSTSYKTLPTATYLQGFFDPTEGHLRDIPNDGVLMDGLMVSGNRLIGTVAWIYDALNEQRFAHFSHSLKLDEPSFSGWSAVLDANKTGFVSGPMSTIPKEWQGVLGGTAATGQCCIPIVSRTSWGPSAFSFNAAQVGQSLAPASPLLYYNADHPTLGRWDNLDPNPTYGLSTQMGGMAIIAGTRTALFIGRTGIGPNCYGNGTADKSLEGTVGTDGAHYCYDPTSSDKGTHAYPYRYQIWAYDLADFAKVKAGTKQPWEVVPYGVWPFELPIAEASVRIGGIGYDPARQLLYVTQMYADMGDGYAYRPIVHVLQVTGTDGVNSASSVEPLATPSITAATTSTTTTSTSTTSTSTTSTSTTTVAPAVTSTTVAPASTSTSLTPTGPAIEATNTVVRSIALAVDKTSPQYVGTAVTFTATATGGQHEYKFLVNGTAATGWSANNAFTWTATSANANHLVAVWARRSGSSKDEAEASASTPFTIENIPPVTAVALGADKPAPQILGATVTFTATPTGGNGPIEYKWSSYDGTAWKDATAWTTTNTFQWTPTAARADYAVRVFARSHGVTTDAAQAQAQMTFAINAPAPVLVKSVALATNKTAPQVAGTAITITATATDGVAPVQFKFVLYDGANWNVLANWTPNNAFTWTPSTANSSHVIRVLARGGNSSSDAPEAEAAVEFPIISAATPVSGVTLTTDKSAPQFTGTTMVMKANISGGGPGTTYRFLSHDGLNWVPVTDWTTSNTFNWTPTQENANGYIGVWVRNAGSTAQTGDATASMPFPIYARPLPITGVTVATDKAAPQQPGTTIVARATVAGGGAGMTYQWMIHDGTNWNNVTGWVAANSYSWTPTQANANHYIGVRVRNMDNTSETGEATGYIPFPISASTNAPISAVTLTTDKAAPQTVGATIVLNANITGGGPGVQYRWLVHDGTSWQTVTGWTTSSTYNWTPTKANPYAYVGVWTRSAGSTSDTSEATATMLFPIQ